MTPAAFSAALRSIAKLAIDTADAIDAEGGDLSADIAMAEDAAALMAPFFPPAAEAEAMIEGAALLTPAVEYLVANPGFGANADPNAHGAVGSR